MDMIKRLNAAMEHIESGLCAELDLDKASGIAGLTADGLKRFFSYMAGLTLNEYIRKRRLSVAALELKDSNECIVDIAVKYGYDSAAAFSRAFTRQHGMTPTEFRKKGGSLKIYPPASFQMIVKGAQEMDLRFIEAAEFEVYGISEQYEGAGYCNREELRHKMWSEEYDNVPSQLCLGKWNQPENHAYDGEWYGIWQNGRYMIARRRTEVKSEGFEKALIPAGTYAAFTTEKGTLAWEEFPRLFGLIYEMWLPGSGYRLAADVTIEVMHLWTDYEKRKRDRYYEIWIPVERIVD